MGDRGPGAARASDPTDPRAALAAHEQGAAAVTRLWVAARWNPRDVALRAALLRAMLPDDTRRAAVVAVAQQLGNTPTVCKGSYIDPRVVDAFERDHRITAAVVRAEKSLKDRLPEIVDDESSCAALTMIAATPPVEKAVLKLLRGR